MFKNTLVALLLLFSISEALPLEIESLGVRFGAASPSLGSRNTPAFGVRTQSRAMPGGIYLHGYLDYWTAKWQQNNTDWTWRLFSSAVSATRRFDFKFSSASTFVGGGIGLNVNIPAKKSKDVAASSENIDIDLALHCLAGVLFPINETLNAVIEIKYVIGGQVDYAGLLVGVNYTLNSTSINKE